jgi:hypothetical protein
MDPAAPHFGRHGVFFRKVVHPFCVFTFRTYFHFLCALAFRTYLREKLLAVVAAMSKVGGVMKAPLGGSTTHSRSMLIVR